jgi:hypothetical protein
MVLTMMVVLFMYVLPRAGDGGLLLPGKQSVPLLLHCAHTVLTLLLHCCHTVVTLLLPFCSTVVAAADSRQHTEERHQTANSRQQKADSGQQPAASRQETADSRQQTADSSGTVPATARAAPSFKEARGDWRTDANPTELVMVMVIMQKIPVGLH